MSLSKDRGRSSLQEDVSVAYGWFGNNLCFLCYPTQLVDLSWQAEMKDGYWLGKDYPGVYQGERQALNEDYTHSGYDRGHLNPNGHHAGLHRQPLLRP